MKQRSPTPKTAIYLAVAWTYVAETYVNAVTWGHVALTQAYVPRLS